MASHGLNSLSTAFGQLLAPVSEALGDELAMAQLLGDLGVVGSSAAELTALLAAAHTLRQDVLTLADTPIADFSTVNRALGIMRQAMSLLRAAGAASGSLPGAPGLGRDLVTWLTSQWLSRHHPAARRLAGLLTLIDLHDARTPTPGVEIDGALVRGPVELDHFRLDRLGALMRDPAALLGDTYMNALSSEAEAAEMASRLFPQVTLLLRNLGLVAHHGIRDTDAAEFGDAADFMRHAMVVYAIDPLTVPDDGAGLALALSPSSRGDLGLVVMPFGGLSREAHVGRWALRFDASTALDGFAWGRHGLTLPPRDPDGPAPAPAASFSFEASRPDEPWVFGDADGTRLELAGLRLRADLMLSDGDQHLTIAAEADAAQVVIAPAGADGFVASLLPAGGLHAALGLGLAWSSRTGLSLRGHTTLEATLPVNLAIGGLSVDALHVGLRAVESQLDAGASASVNASLGPVRATVHGVGFEVNLSGNRPDGNLGIADLRLGFKRPHGVSLSIDAQGVLAGGGFLAHDAATDGYAGALQVSLRSGLTLSAYGLIATRMPEGRRGYSLLVFVTAEGFRPIPLGMGFSLRAIGGMLGVHRTIDVAALRTTLREGRLGQVLLPGGPLAHAPDLLRTLDAVFPVREGSHLLTLAARITWFEPVLIRMDLALTLELGANERLLAMGRVSALLPSAENDLIRLNLDALGVLDFAAGTLEADALLTDSRIAHRFPVTGAAALRTRWTESPDEAGMSRGGFALSVGGFNPRYSPPAGFPELERVRIALTRGRSPRVLCDAYFAITPNTVQFGALASIYAEALGFSISGELAFDALVSLVPPRFLVDFRAQVQLKRGSRNLFKIQLRGLLEGPLPLRLQASARFEILWIDFTVRLDLRLAEGDSARLPAPIWLEQELRQLIGMPSSWRAASATLAPHGVTVRAVHAPGQLVVDPLGQLILDQQLVPLNAEVEVDTFAGVPVEGARRFRVTGSLGHQAGTPTRGAFAPSRYFAMTDDEKLVAPAYRAFDAGLALGAEAATFASDDAVALPLSYAAPIVIDGAPGAGPQPTLASWGPTSTSTSQALSADEAGAHLSSGPAARSPLRRSGAARFRNRCMTPAVTVRTAC